MGKIARYLNQLTIGNVFDTPEILEAYSTDRSVLKIKPKLVALPESTEDIRKLMRFCYQLALKGIKIPVTVRGSGLDELGADLSNGLILSTEKMNKLLESDKRERLVRVQAGITLRELNTALSMNGLTIPIGGRDNETIGGLVANNSTDIYAGKYGGITKYVERIEVVLANGDILQTGRIGRATVARKASEKTLEGTIYRRLTKLVTKKSKLLDEIRHSNKNLSGYPTIIHVSKNGAVDLMPIFFGSEGTLGVITEVILHAVPIENKAERVVATFEDYATAEKFLELAESLKPKELNLYDIRVIKAAAESGKRLSSIAEKLESGFVVFARFDRKGRAAVRKLSTIRKVLPKSSQLIVDSSKTRVALDEFENSLVSFLNQTKNGERVPLLTDFSVPAKNLGAFLSDIKILENSLKMELAIFGSYGTGCYSLRPKFAVDDPEFNKKATTFLRTGAFIINRQGGSLTGGTPEGRVKAIVTGAEVSEELMDLYAEVKNIFDKNGILNPGAKLGADSRYTLRHFRDGAAVKVVV